MTVTFTVPGKPRGKGRPRFMRSGHTYTDEKTRSYERTIQACYRLYHSEVFTGPIGVRITALFPIPKNKRKSIIVRMMLGLLRPLVKPDGDNIEKAVLHLQNAWFAAGDFLVLESCRNYISELNTYSWKEDKDEPEDGHDHCINSCQYAWLPIVEFIGADRVDYEMSRGFVKAVVFRSAHYVKDKRYELRERYMRGRIESRLYDSGGNEVPFDTVPELEGIKSVIEFSGDYMMAVPVRFFENTNHMGRGKSLFAIGSTRGTPWSRERVDRRRRWWYNKRKHNCRKKFRSCK